MRSLQPYDFLFIMPWLLFPVPKERHTFVIAAHGAIRGADSEGGELIFTKCEEKKAGGLLPQLLRAAPLAF